ncbi:MAG TPA: hypothetical protein VF817_00805 [Patescibacteria group bacterium]
MACSLKKLLTLTSRPVTLEDVERLKERLAAAERRFMEEDERKKPTQEFLDRECTI